MTTAPEAPAVAVPAWESARCVGCGKRGAATLPVGGQRLCAVCVLLTAQKQLNRESIAAGHASLVPAPAAWGDVDAPHALLGCEGCIPMPRGFVAFVGAMWLCAECVADGRSGRRRRG